jgi:hypothetical protein
MNELIRTFNDSKLAPIIVVKIQQTLQRQFQHLEHLYFIFHQEIPLTQRIPIPTYLFRFVKSTSLANNSKFCFKNKFPTGSQLFVSYNYLHNIPTWIILSPRSSIITHRNVNSYWILTIRVQLTLQQHLSFQRSIFYYNYLLQSSSVLLSLELKYLTRSFVISWALKVSALSRRFGTLKV